MMLFFAKRSGRSSTRRHRILNYVEEYPGAHVAQMVKDLNIPRTTLMHHISKLNREQRLRFVPDGAYVRVLPRNQVHAALSELAALSYPRERDTHSLLLAHGQLGIMDLARLQRLSRKQATASLSRLMESGLVLREPKTRGKFYLKRNDAVEFEPIGPDLCSQDDYELN